MAEQTVEGYLKEQASEWGAYVALEPIDINGARAFNPGDPVPASHVSRGVVSKASVAATNTKAAAVVVEEKKA